jgi:hypothetical protein
MASGNTLFTLFPIGSIPSASSFATVDTIGDLSAVSTQLMVLDYAGATADEHATWDEMVPSTYAAGGLSFQIVYAPDGTNASTIQFEIRAKPVADLQTISTHNLQGATAIDSTDTPTSTANAVNYAVVTTMTHSQAGSPVVGDVLRFMISRDYDHTASADDMQLIAVYVRET